MSKKELAYGENSGWYAICGQDPGRSEKGVGEFHRRFGESPGLAVMIVGGNPAPKVYVGP